MTNTSLGWHYQLQSRSGEITGSAVVESLIGGLATSELLAREALQNSCDATLPNEETIIRIRQTITDKSLLNTIGASDEFKRYLTESFVENNAGTLDEGHINLVLEDFNTVGLGGNLNNAGHDNHFMRLIYHNATASKNFHASSKGSGGSFGRGKAAYAISSSIYTVFYYTRFVNTEGIEDSRLIGVSYAREHQDANGNQRTGRAFWGINNSSEGNFFIDPLTGSAAHEYAVKLGFTERGMNNLGTSILILNCPVKPAEIMSAIEKWWWPRLEDNLLDITVTTLDGNIFRPAARDNRQLWEYINVYHELSNKQSTTRIKKSDITRKNIEYGTIGYTAIDNLTAENIEFDEDLTNAIALIRAPKMVVSYEIPRRISRSHNGCGVFIANPEYDNLYKRSEPPAHDKWDANSSRLSDEEKTTLKDILKQTKDAFRSFVNSLEGEVDPQGRSKLLERLLGDLFGGRRGLVVIEPDTSSDSFSVRNQHGNIIETGTNRVKHAYSFSLSLKRESTLFTADAEISVICQLAAKGSGGRSELTLPFEKVTVDDKAYDLNEVQPITIQLTKTPCEITFLTGPTNATYQTNWVNSIKLTNIVDSEVTNAEND